MRFLHLRTKTAGASCRSHYAGRHGRPSRLCPGLDLVIDERRVWKGRFPVDVMRFRQRRFDGTFVGREAPGSFGGAAVRAAMQCPTIRKPTQVVLIEQFRLPALAAGIDPVMVEVPAGLCRSAERPRRRRCGARRGRRPGCGSVGSTLHPIGDFPADGRGLRRTLCAMLRRAMSRAAGGCFGHHRRMAACRAKARTSASASGRPRRRSRRRWPGGSPIRSPPSACCGSRPSARD